MNKRRFANDVTFAFSLCSKSKNIYPDNACLQFLGKSRLKNPEKVERNYFFRSFFPLSALAIFGIS
ncbi:hypothetical protein AB4Y90_13515, partial [Chryseobacterium sp. 2TAF14]|uniref:hypothetical protein n=1 Tax=Chryseobacterium sp. 2TAF14 TaxID=3233007 RepID=UPI003F8EA8B4